MKIANLVNLLVLLDPLKILNGTKLILDDHGNNLDSFRISLEPSKTQQLVRNYFLPFLTANRL